jgi:2-iminobutanoate/2-iminopropanoate deaminase
MCDPKVIEGPGGPRPVGAYSQGVRAGSFVFASGQGPIDASTGKIIGTTIEEQTAVALANAEAVLMAAGSSRRDVVKVTAYLSDVAMFEGYDRAYRGFFKDWFPARTTVGSELQGILVEIDAIAYIPSARARAQPLEE